MPPKSHKYIFLSKIWASATYIMVEWYIVSEKKLKNEEECVCWLGWKAGWKLVEISKQLPSLRGFSNVSLLETVSYGLIYNNFDGFSLFLLWANCLSLLHKYSVCYSL